MDELTTFQKVMTDLGAGDQQAAEVVFKRFTGRLLGLARSQLDARLQQKVDPEDVLQSVYQSFFRRQNKDEFDLDSWDGLWALLVTITVRKCCKQARRYRGGKRDITREQSVQQVDHEEEELGEWELISREPTPEQALLLTELLEMTMHPFDEQSQTIITMRLQGYSEREISEEINRSERTVRRILKLVRAQLIKVME